ncbi:MAG: helix-turn-helix domain-containing protein [Thaumarchaeota archaeon]|nr:helix-turn-helix domain-containing protein [Candidatus Calditenuaceae archaeon]MDW8186500.1 helix-turn-helix domain-containing protein [Nitrososphaerota archaeon]
MNSTEARAVKVLLGGPMTVDQLGLRLGISKPHAYLVVKSLMKMGLAEKAGNLYMISGNPVGKVLQQVAQQYDVTKILKGAAPDVLYALFTPKNLEELIQNTELSRRTVWKTLIGLMEVGVVKKINHRYHVVEDETIRLLITLLRMIKWQEAVEPEAVVLFSNGFIIKSVPRGMLAKGELTAFSRFKDYGVLYITDRDYYAYPADRIGREEVLVHALLSSRTKQERTMCAVFYMANRTNIDLLRARKIAKKTPVISVLLDLESYVEGLPVANPDIFLPWNEFRDLCSQYGIKAHPSLPSDEIMSNIEKWAREVERETTVYLLGGINMVIRGIKPSTKDIDILVRSREDYQTVEKALTAAGFRKTAEWTQGDLRANPSNIFIHPTLMRVDVFTEEVARVKVSQKILDRATFGIALGKLKLMLLDLNDVVFLKLLTSRERDIGDAAETIRRHGVDWKKIIEEIHNLPKEIQAEKSFTILDNLDMLEKNYAIRTPRKIVNLVRKTAVDKAIEYLLEKGETDPVKIAEYAETSPAYVKRKLREILNRSD